MIASFTPAPIAPEVTPAPVIAHDAADDGMDGDFSAAAVVGEVVG